MKSIRVSLIVYFLSLLVLGLGGVSVLAYRTAAETLADKEVSGREQVMSEYRARAKDLEEELDSAMVQKANKVVNRLSRPYRVEWLNVMPVVGTPMIPMGFLNLAADLRMGTPPLSSRLTPLSLRFHEVRSLDQIVFALEEPEHGFEAAITNFRNGQVWERTNNIAFHPLKVDVRETTELMHFDEVVIGELTCRRLTLKVPQDFKIPAPPPAGVNPPWKGVFRGPLSPSALQKWRALSESYFFIQYIVDTDPLNKRLDRLIDERNDRLAQLSIETSRALHDLRQRLITFCGLTTLGVLVGGLVLIWMKLAPLHRLSEAVSRVNEKDFNLRIDPRSLPSELQPVAQRLRRALEQLSDAFAREKQSAQNISHDLRTPLAALTTTIEVALKKERSPAEYREFLEDCQLSAVQMSHLVERLLALAKIDAGASPARPRPIDLVEVAQHAADVVRPLAKARDIALSLHTPRELPMIADADKMGEVLTNLLHNAVDYNRDSGRIDLSVRRLENAVVLSVADTGVGIRPEDRAHLFDRFYRADKSRSGDSPHCGLGLAIVKSYVELMGGTISVDSELGAGSTFTIRLPYAAPPVEIEEAFAASIVLEPSKVPG